MLWFIPASWGSVDEDGDFTPFKLLVAVIAAIAIGCGIVGFIVNAVKAIMVSKIRLKYIEELELENDCLKRANLLR